MKEICIKEILAKYLPYSPPDSLNVSELVTEIKKHHISKHGERLTNYQEDGRITLRDGVQFEFLYKRDLLKILSPEAIQKYLGVNENPFHSVHPYFLNSGQAGINTVLLFLKAVLDTKKIKHHSPLYIGVQQLMELYDLSSGDSDALWICSSSISDQEFDRILSSDDEFKFVIFDSTCWGLSDPRISLLLKRFKDSNVFLIRSVSKLDMGGVEYGSLGSLVVCLPKEGLDTLAAVEKWIKLTGGAPSVDDIPPYLFDDEYLQFLSQREIKLRNIQKEIRDHSNWDLPSGVQTYFPDHGKYFFCFFDHDQFLNKEKELQILLIKALNLNGVPNRTIASFGFDECVLSFFTSDDRKGVYILRVNPGLGPDRAEQVIKVFKEFFWRITKQ